MCVCVCMAMNAHIYIREYKNNIPKYDLIWSGLDELEMGLGILLWVQQGSNRVIR